MYKVFSQLLQFLLYGTLAIFYFAYRAVSKIPVLGRYVKYVFVVLMAPVVYIIKKLYGIK